MKKIDLPGGFRNWTELYTKLEQSGVQTRNSVSIMVDPSPDQNGNVIERKEYNVSDIRNMLLEELWQQKKNPHFDKDDLRYLSHVVRSHIDEAGPSYLLSNQGEIVLEKVAALIEEMEYKRNDSTDN